MCFHPWIAIKPHVYGPVTLASELVKHHDGRRSAFFQVTNNVISEFTIEGYHHFQAVSTSTEFYSAKAVWYLQQKLEEGDEDSVSLAWLYHEAIPHFIKEEI